MPPRKRPMCKEPELIKPKPFRAVASEPEDSPEPTLRWALGDDGCYHPVQPPPPATARQNALERCIASVLFAALPVCALYGIIREYADYVFDERKHPACATEIERGKSWGENIGAADGPTALSGNRFISVLSREFISARRPTVGKVYGVDLTTFQRTVYDDYVAACYQIHCICATPDGTVYIATEKALFKAVDGLAHMIASENCNSDNSGGVIPRFIKFDCIHSMVSNREGTALIIADGGVISVKRLSLDPVEEHSVYWDPTMSPITGYMCLTQDLSDRFGVGMFYFTLDVIIVRTTGSEVQKRLIRTTETGKCDRTGVGLESCPFDSLMFGMVCTPNGTIIVANGRSASVYAVDPGVGSVECLRAPPKDHMSSATDPFVIHSIFSLAMCCEPKEPLVNKWFPKDGFTQLTLPVEFWGKSSAAVVNS